MKNEKVAKGRIIGLTGLVQGLSDETLCNLLGCIQAEQYRFRLVHLRTIIVYMAKVAEKITDTD